MTEIPGMMFVPTKNGFNCGQTQFKMIEAIQEFFNNHLWYLTLELVVFGLFDDGLTVARPNLR